MPAPRRSSRRPVSLAAAASGTLLAALCLAVTVPVGAATGASSFADCGKITVDSKNLGAKFPKGGDATTTFNDVTIKVAGCGMEIKARRGETTSLDTNDSDWTLDGNVRIRSDQQQSRLSSDHAVVQFRNGEVQRITITGKPAEFEQQRPGTGQVTRGHANQIVYESGPGTVRLVDDAWLSDGGKEIKTPQLVYDIRRAEIRNTGIEEGSTRSGSGSSERVIITIDPKASKGAKKDDSKPAPAPAKP
jgi:lipopolysaccharide transport protein LptA